MQQKKGCFNSMENRILSAIQRKSFVVLEEDPYEFTASKERQMYGSFHYECSYDENGNCTINKCTSRVSSSRE